MNLRAETLLHLRSFRHLRIPLLILSLASPRLQSQIHRLEFERISIGQGLSSVWVTAIHQDRQGFLWLGTMHGLNRYDGSNFTVFRANPADSTSLRRDEVTCLEEDEAGTLWVGTWAGLHRYDPRRMQFTHFSFSSSEQPSNGDAKITSLSKDNAGTLWLGTEGGGLYNFSPNEERFASYRHDSRNTNSLSNDTIRTLMTSVDGSVWVATAQGVDVFAPETKVFTHFRNNKRERTKELMKDVYAIIEGKDGVLWFGTWEQGLLRFDRKTNSLTAFAATGFTPGRSSPIWINSLWEDGEGCIWIGTITEGLMIFDPKTESFRQYRYDPGTLKSLGSRNVSTIVNDRSGIIWVGTIDGGLSKCNTRKRKFELYTFEFDGHKYQNHNDIGSVYEDREGILWLGTIGKRTDPGLIRFDRRTGAYERVASHDSPLPNVYSIQEDPRGIFWLATYGDGLIRFNRSKQEFRSFLNIQPGLSENFVRTLYLDHSGILWIGTRTSGLYRLSLLNNSLSRVHADNPQLNQIVTIGETKRNQLWVGTGQNGLFAFDAQKEHLTQYVNIGGDTTTLAGNAVTVVHEARDGSYWIGTTDGLSKYDPPSGTFRSYTARNGFPANSVSGILEDHAGNLWISSDLGIIRFSQSIRGEGEFRLFHPVDGIQSGAFNRGSYFRSKKGEFFFGGKEGLNSFLPEDVVDRRDVPPVALLSVRIKNRTVPIEKALDDNGNLVLDYEDNVVTFEFSALEFTEPSLNQYSCTMEGFEKGWNHLGDQRSATYTNLDPDSYVLRVKASNVDGVWNEKSTSLFLTVKPPYWRTWWFRTLLVGAILGVVLFFVVQRERSLALRRQTQERFSRQLIESQELERKRIASELHDSLGQNILIMKNNALLAIQKKGDLERVEKHLNDISSVASQTLDETRRIAYNLRPFQLDRFGLTEAIRVMIHDAETISTIQFIVTIESIDDCFAKENEISVFRILQEAVNNILKHSGGNRATINISRSQSHVSIHIADNGRGYDPAERSQYSGIRGRQGGFGIPSIRERVQILGGTFTIESVASGGTNLTITLPESGKV